MNHRFLLRLVTNLAIFLLSLSCLGIVLWVIDQFLLWDILPEGWSLLVQAALIAGGIIAFVLVVMNLLLSLALMAESNAARADLPNYGISPQVKRRVRQSILATIVAVALLIGGLQITDYLRARTLASDASAEFIQAQATLDDSMQQVLNLFTPPLLEAIDTNTLAEKGQLGNMAKLFSSIQSSFPNSPTVALLTPAAQAPFKYARIDNNSIRSNGNGTTILDPELYATFPNAIETEAVEQLLAGKLPTIAGVLQGKLINNTVPSSWGVLKRNGKVIAVVYLQSNDGFNEAVPYNAPAPARDIHHSGPERLLSNTN